MIKVIREPDSTRFFRDGDEIAAIVFAGWYDERDMQEQRMFWEVFMSDKEESNEAEVQAPETAETGAEDAAASAEFPAEGNSALTEEETGDASEEPEAETDDGSH